MPCCSVITRSNLFAALLLAVLASGCAPTIVPLSRNTPPSPAAFHLVAQTVIRPNKSPARRFQIVWRRALAEDGTQDSVQIKDPFGITRAQFTQTPLSATIDIGGKTYSGKNATALSAKILGYALPVPAFGYWIVGVAAPTAPAETTQNIGGEIVEISQLGWKIAYRQRDANGKPKQILLTAPAAKIDIKIKEWLLP